MNFKKGQSGSGAATLVAIIALLIILYILFLPPATRDEILGDNTTTNGNGDSSAQYYNRTILLENPGTLDALKFSEYEHAVPSVRLHALETAKVLKKVNSIYIKNGVFDRKFNEFSFKIDDLTNTENVMLSFTAKKHTGMLVILLNGEEILNTQIDRASPEPIALEKENLQEENTLRFEVSGVGWAFWKTNEYILENIQVTADIKDITDQESRNTFLITTTEATNIEKAKIQFYPDCSTAEVGTLDVYVNNKNVYSAVPDCGALVKQEFSPGYLDAGENKVVFKIDRGSLLVDQIAVKTELQEIIYPVYYFELTDDEYKEVRDGNLDVNMTMRFINDGEYKDATIYVNGHKTYIHTVEQTWYKSITSYVEEGSNGIKIVPDTRIDIIELRVALI